jgi:hypothetical protein
MVVPDTDGYGLRSPPDVAAMPILDLASQPRIRMADYGFSRHSHGLPIVVALPSGVAISRRILCTLQRSNAGSCPRRLA